MGAHTGSDGPTQRRAGTHRRTGQALIERRDHTTETPRRRPSLPAPSPSALVGIAVLVLIGIGAIHLSGSGSAVPLEAEPTVQVQPEASDVSGASGGGDSGNSDSEGVPSPEDAPSPDAAPSGDGAELVVHVSGAVAAPGVVHLPAGARVDDALQAAGGPTDDADLSAVNLARPVGDGEQIHLPVPGEEPRAGEPAAAGPGPSGAAEAPAAGSSGVIDLNTASAAELEELPGVGPAIAQRIIEHREKNGPFRSVDDLLEVSGIGPSTLEKIRDRATT